MELRGDLPQRRISLGRKDQHDQASAEIDRPVQQPQADRHGDNGHRDRGDELERGGGEERESQGSHGRSPMLISPPANRFDLTLCSTEQQQRGQALDDVEEVPAKDGQRSPLTSRRLCGAAPDQHAEQWDERQRAENYRRRPAASWLSTTTTTAAGRKAAVMSAGRYCAK